MGHAGRRAALRVMAGGGLEWLACGPCTSCRAQGDDGAVKAVGQHGLLRRVCSRERAIRVRQCR